MIIVMHITCKGNNNNYLKCKTTSGKKRSTNTNSKGKNERNIGVLFKDCTSFTDCITEINNTNIDKAQGMDVAMSMYNLI